MATSRKAGGRTAGSTQRRDERAKAQRRVLEWYGEHHRSFPWRQTRDPYRIFVAETMLQQTQTGRVQPVYTEFTRRFPTVERLARAPAMEVIQAWKGLGYNRRAVDLHETAQTVVHDHAGVFPRDPAALRRLRGVGGYTAAAVACFAFDAQVPVVDTNVRRILARVERGRETDGVPLREVTAIAAAWLPDGDAYRWNQALMDVGTLVCRPAQPLCSRCPLRTACRYYAKGLHRAARPRRARAAEPFEGSRRQQRGGIVDHLREAAASGLTLARLARALHPDREDPDLEWLVPLLDALERDGLVEMTPAARRGSPRGIVRLPS